MGKKNKEKSNVKKQKQIEKQIKNSKKKADKQAKKEGEESIESILNEIVKKDLHRTAISVSESKQPSRRINFTLTSLPNGDAILFGGEYFDGEVNVCYNELYRWSVDTNTWKCIESPNTPPPRCSHQAVLYRDFLYIFGGEFATADQFHHYRDLWRMDIKTNAWECIMVKGGPSPRSGHRMVVWRNYLVLFGGFYEAFRDTRWFNDLYLFNFADNKWKKIDFPVHKFVPGARSGCQMVVHPSNDTVFMFGGYAKVKTSESRAVGKVFSDMWALSLGPVVKSQMPVWEKLSKKGNAPSPRSGASMTVYRNRALLFGGVLDEEGLRHTMKSTFYNDLYAFDMDRRRWFLLNVRSKANKQRRKKKKLENEIDDNEEQQNDLDENSDGDKSEEEDANRFGYMDADGNLVYMQDAFEGEFALSSAIGRASSSEQDESKCEEDESKCEEDESMLKEELTKDTKFECEADNVPASSIEEESVVPSARINPAMMLRNHTLYLYGGFSEVADREITMDDCWSLDMKKLDAWHPVLEGTMDEQVWKGDDSDADDSYNGSDDDDMYTDDESEDEGIFNMPNISEGLAEMQEENEIVVEKKKKSGKVRKTLKDEIQELQSQLQLSNSDETPQVGEHLRDFFSRTCNHWAQQVANLPETIENQLSGKEMKRKGFALAEVRYNELLPVLDRINDLERQQKEAEEESKNDKKTVKKRR